MAQSAIARKIHLLEICEKIRWDTRGLIGLLEGEDDTPSGLKKEVQSPTGQKEDIDVSRI